jgi:hypothetical protein
MKIRNKLGNTENSGETEKQMIQSLDFGRGFQKKFKPCEADKSPGTSAICTTGLLTIVSVFCLWNFFNLLNIKYKIIKL